MFRSHSFLGILAVAALAAVAFVENIVAFAVDRVRLVAASALEVMASPRVGTVTSLPKPDTQLSVSQAQYLRAPRHDRPTKNPLWSMCPST